MSLYLTLTDSLSSASGGLSHAALNHSLSMASAMPRDQHILLAQKDSHELKPPYQPPANFKIIKEPCFRNSYFPISQNLNTTLCSLEPDLVHLRGLWRQSSLAAMAWKSSNPNKKLIVQTAGMLVPWARKRNSLLKRLYFRLVESNLLNLCDYFHATSEAECESLVSLGIPRNKIFVVQEGVYLPSSSSVQNLSKKRDSEPRNLLFLSRLHPVKGLDILLESWSLLRPEGWHCQIVGSGETAYQNYLASEIKRLNLTESVHMYGPMLDQEKDKMFANASAFILPSYSESYGIAVAEALSWSLPVITTTSTPWDHISSNEMGWYVEPTAFGISKALYLLFNTESERLRQMGFNGRRYISQKLSWTAVAQALKSYYEVL